MEKHGLTTVISVSTGEKEVLKWMAHGKGTIDISQVMGIRERTVKFHVGNIKKKLDAGSRAHAVAIAMNKGLIEIDENLSAFWDCPLTGQKTDIDRCLRTKSSMSGACKECQLGIENSGGN